MSEAQSIYIAPDIRKQKFENMQNFVEEKRVRRMILADKYRQTVLEKAEKLHGKVLEKFQRQVDMFDRQMNSAAALFEKMDERIAKMSEMHSELTNLEGVIDAEKS